MLSIRKRLVRLSEAEACLETADQGLNSENHDPNWCARFRIPGRRKERAGAAYERKAATETHCTLLTPFSQPHNSGHRGSAMATLWPIALTGGSDAPGMLFCKGVGRDILYYKAELRVF